MLPSLEPRYIEDVIQEDNSRKRPYVCREGNTAHSSVCLRAMHGTEALEKLTNSLSRDSLISVAPFGDECLT